MEMCGKDDMAVIFSKNVVIASEVLSSDGLGILGFLASLVWYVSSHTAEQPLRLPFMPPDEPKTSKHHDGLRCLMPYLMNCNLTSWVKNCVLCVDVVVFACIACIVYEVMEK